MIFHITVRSCQLLEQCDIPLSTRFNTSLFWVWIWLGLACHWMVVMIRSNQFKLNPAGWVLVMNCLQRNWLYQAETLRIYQSSTGQHYVWSSHCSVWLKRKSHTLRNSKCTIRNQILGHQSSDYYPYWYPTVSQRNNQINIVYSIEKVASTS